MLAPICHAQIQFWKAAQFLLYLTKSYGKMLLLVYGDFQEILLPKPASN